MEHIRPLGTFEHFRATLHDLGFHYNVALSGRYESEDKFLGPKTLYEAVRSLLTKHPALNVTIRESPDGHPGFVRLPDVNLDNVVRYRHEARYDQDRDKILDSVLTEENSTGFDMESNNPLWRIVVVYNEHTSSPDLIQAPKAADIIFIWHHAIGDGHSGLFILYDMLDILNSPSPAKSVPISNTNTVIAPALETLLKMPSSIQSRVRRLSTSIFGDWTVEPATKKWSGSDYQADPPIKTSIQHIRVPHASVAGLAARCRTEHVSITALMQTIVRDVLFTTFSDADDLRCATAISLRRFMNEPEYQVDAGVMGMWVSAFHIEYPRRGGVGHSTRNFSWDDARKNKARIEREVAKGDTDVETGALRAIKDFKATLMAKLGNQRQDSFAVTNLGVVPSLSATSSSWKLTDVVFSQSCHVNGSAIQFCIISTEGGDMVVSLSSQQGIVPQDDLNIIAEDLQKRLVALGGT